MLFQTQVKDHELLKFAQFNVSDHAYCATPRNSNTPVDFDDDNKTSEDQKEGEENLSEAKAETEEETCGGKGKKGGKKGKKAPAPGTRYKIFLILITMYQ